MKKSAIIVAIMLTTRPGPAAHAQTPSSILESLPGEVQKRVEEVRAACREQREQLKDITVEKPEILSGDDGLVQFMLSDALAVMVSDISICGGYYKGANSNTAGYLMAIYVQSGGSWKTAHDDGVRSSDIFLSLDYGNGDPPTFRAMVVGIPGDSKDCPQRDMFMRIYGDVAWRHGSCDVIVRWNGTSFTYEALSRTPLIERQ